MAEVLRGILMYDRGDRVRIADLGDGSERRGSVDHDMGGATVSIFIDGHEYSIRRSPHEAASISREALTLIQVDEDGCDIDSEEDES